MEVSVVMCVYNGLPGLRKAVESILGQDGVELELVVVDDGSTDGSLAVIEEYAARDERLKVLGRKHHGLTDALICGCAEVSGEFVARQDAGDVSLPDRLRKQLARLSADSSLSMVSCGTRYFGPDGEFLYEVQQSSGEADRALRSADLATLQGPSHHGSTMFRKDHYVRAGGYRPQFKVAQDLDLWTRLAEIGRHDVVQEVLYKSSLGPGTISTEKRAQQEAARKVISECMRSRMATGDDSRQLERAKRILENGASLSRRKSDADFYYFLASCLRQKDPRRSRHYLMEALRKNPLHLKALVRAVQTQIGAF